GVVGAAIYVLAALTLIGPLGMPGLALANALQNSAHAVILYVLLARVDRALVAPRLGGYLVRVLIGGACAAVATALVSNGLAGPLGDSGAIGRLIQLAVAGGVGAVTYVIALLVM